MHQSDMHQGKIYYLQAVKPLKTGPIALVGGLMDCGHHDLPCSSCSYCNQAAYERTAMIH